MVVFMCFSACFSQTYYSKLGFNWEKNSIFKYQLFWTTNSWSKSWQLLIEEDEPLFMKSVSRLINMFYVFIETDERGEDRLMMKVYCWRISDYFYFVSLLVFPYCVVNTQINKIQMWDVIVKKYANYTKGFLFIFIPFSEGFSVL